MNLHRSPFGGRNFEYQSEDGLLAGKIVAAQVAGAQGEGLYTYVKHFALNEQETFRQLPSAHADEQTMRELYFKPFELAVKDGGATAVMSSFNYIGGVWAGGSSELLNTVLRDEWGFRGMVITDYFGNYGYLSADRAIANGNDLMLSTLGRFGAMPEREDAVAVQHMRRRARTSCTPLRTATRCTPMPSATRSWPRSAARRIQRIPEVRPRSGPAPGEVGPIINGAIALLLVGLVIAVVRKFRKLFGSAEATRTEG